MKKLSSVVFSLVLMSAVAFGFFHTRDILDWVALQGYNPPAEIDKLATDTTMLSGSRKVFYVNKPKIEDKQNFSNSCPDHEQTIVLGCYINNQGIYLLNVTDTRLNGVVQVTAAHELLHAEYDRLKPGERAKVDKMTADFFATLTDERIKSNIENYRKNDPSVVPNELHSILGTEVRNLSPELENYYKKYFSNRATIVGFSEKYESTFTDIENQVKELDVQLKQMKTELDAKDAELKKLGNDIESQRNYMNGLLSSKKIDQYNSQVETFNALVNKYNSLVKSRQAQANQYNKMVDQYNNLATTESNLIQSLQADNVKPVEGAQ